MIGPMDHHGSSFGQVFGSIVGSAHAVLFLVRELAFYKCLRKIHTH